MARASVERRWASTQRAVGPAQESQDEGLEIEGWIGAVTCRAFSIAESRQENAALWSIYEGSHGPPNNGGTLVPEEDCELSDKTFKSLINMAT